MSIADMSGHEVIDLLSTDDEAPARIPGLQQGPGMMKAQAKPISTDFAFLSDDLDDEAHFDGWTDKPAKKRKLTPSPSTANNIPLPQLSHISGNNSPSKVASRLTTVVKQKNQWIDLSDLIIFPSSPHQKSTTSRPRKSLNPPPQLSDESDDEFPDDPRSVTLQQHVPISDRTAALIASLKAPSKRKTSADRKKSGGKAEAKATKPLLESDDDEDGAETVPIVHDKPASSKTSKKPKLTENEKAAKAQDKEASKAAEKARKTKEKEDEKEKKRLAKEEKAREKQIAADLAEANRSRMDKKLTTPEIIVDLPASIDSQSVDTQTREILKNLGVDTNVYQSPIPNVIKWRRKVDRVYNAERGHWDPLYKTVIQDGMHVMCLMTAKEFVALASADPADFDGEDLEAHVLKFKSNFETCTPIYLIEGLNAWMRKNKTIRNRAYQAAVLNQDNQGNGFRNDKQAKRKKPIDQYVDEDMIEDALLRLQVINSCLIHHTATTTETAEWIANFTQHISTIPYKYSTPSD